MSSWCIFINCLIFYFILLLIKINKHFIHLMIWAEILWILLFLLIIIYSSWSNALILVQNFFILICTAIEISLLSLIFLNFYFKK